MIKFLDKLMKKPPCVAAVIAAAGDSSRMGLPAGESKQFIEIGGRPVIARTVAVFEACPVIDEIVVAARPCDIARLEALRVSEGWRKVTAIVAGGASRQESAENGAAALGKRVDFVAVHDGARCFVTVEDIEKVVKRAFECGAATAANKITDTVKRVDGNGIIEETLDREKLWSVQTPQVFRKDLYLCALAAAKKRGIPLTDDAAAAELAGFKVSVVPCGRGNIKLTTEEDLRGIEN